MALLSKREFADKCGILTKNLSNYIKRGKVIVIDDRIDDTDLVNAQFCEHSRKKHPDGPAVMKVEAEITPGGEVMSTPKPKAKAKPKSNSKSDDRFDIDTRLAGMKVRKLEQETRLMQLNEERKIGQMLPTQPTSGVMAILIKEQALQFKQETDKLLTEWSKRFHLNRNDLAEMKRGIINIINSGSERANQNARKAVDNIVLEFSQLKKA